MIAQSTTCINCSMCFAPIADMLNHSSLKQTAQLGEFAQHQNRQGRKQKNKRRTAGGGADGDSSDADAWAMYAIADIPAGEEVMNHYGKLSNVELLHRYGFVDTANPFNVVDFVRHGGAHPSSPMCTYADGCVHVHVQVLQLRIPV